MILTRYLPGIRRTYSYSPRSPTRVLLKYLHFPLSFHTFTHYHTFPRVIPLNTGQTTLNSTYTHVDESQFVVIRIYAS